MGIDAPPTVVVGALATATWRRDDWVLVSQINLVQDDPKKFSQNVLDPKEMIGLSGLVTFTIPSPG
ncbi:hypothetical protein PQX77_014990 [Marasmius sp. AFHP31]|nr:hypothetical protein PQX77_014990 [Marasmius sp. AFHP31]